MTLSLKHLKTIRGLLYSIRWKWYDIGIELEVDVNLLDDIKSRCHGDASQCFLEVLKVWLKSAPTWQALSDALTAEAVNEEALAEKGTATVTALLKLGHLKLIISFSSVQLPFLNAGCGYL